MSMPQVIRIAAASLVLVTALTAPSSAQKNDGKSDPKRPKVSLKARPDVGIAPVKVTFNAEFAGGSDDFEEYYCPTVAWEWGDNNASESRADCKPYEAGKTSIVRKYTGEHTYKQSGRYRVYVSFKQHGKEVAVANVIITVQPGGTDNSN